MPDIKKVAILLRQVPRPLRDLFKAACARRGSNMTREVTRFMREYVANDGKVIPQRRRGR